MLLTIPTGSSSRRFFPEFYLRCIRINKSNELLVNTNFLKRHGIAVMGYSSNSTFTRAFHNVTGMTPQGVPGVSLLQAAAGLIRLMDAPRGGAPWGGNRPCRILNIMSTKIKKMQPASVAAHLHFPSLSSIGITGRREDENGNI